MIHASDESPSASKSEQVAAYAAIMGLPCVDVPLQRTHRLMILVEGSHGQLVVDAATGHIVSRTATCGCEECAPGVDYPDILFFDPAGFDADTRMCGATDILYTSPVYVGGNYARAMSTATIQRKGEEPWSFADEVYLLPDLRRDGR